MSKEITMEKAYSTVIDICKMLKPHSTNVLLMENGHLMLQPVLPGIVQYAIINEDVDYSWFVGLYIDIVNASSTHSKFKKTMSVIDFLPADSTGQEFLSITNKDNKTNEYTEPYLIPIIIENARKNMCGNTYFNLRGMDINPFDEDLLAYRRLEPDFIDRMLEKQLCKLNIKNVDIYISRPFLGNLKKTQWLGVRVIKEDDFSITLQFKQKESLGEIHTIASFLKQD